MKRFAAAVLAILGMAVSSIGAAQSVKFAIGQTWTGTFQGFGTWTAKFTELDDEGDPRGITSAGPDERTAGGVDSNGRSPSCHPRQWPCPSSRHRCPYP